RAARRRRRDLDFHETAEGTARRLGRFAAAQRRRRSRLHASAARVDVQIRSPGQRGDRVGCVPGMTRAVFVVVMPLAATAAAADAQGLSIVPSFAITRIYDDNVFYRPSGESDLTTRFSPRIDMTYGTDRLSWSTRYAIDADQFDRHPQLSTAHA